jgi:hypothetical protein
MTAPAPYGLKSIHAEYAYATGWTAQAVYCLPESLVAAFISGNYLAEFAASTYMAVVRITDEPWMEGDVVLSTGFSQSRKVTLHFAVVYLDVPWPSNITRPDYASGTTLKLRTHFAAEHLPMSGRSLKPASGPVPSPNSQETLVIAMDEYDIEWDRVEDTSDLDFDGYVGFVNSDEFLGQPAGTLYCAGADQAPSFVLDPLNPVSWKTNVHIRKRCITVEGGAQDGEQFGWNDWYNPHSQQWEAISLTNGQDKYASTTFAGMFS